LVWQRCLYNLLRKVLRGSHSLKLLRPPLPRSLQDFLSAIHIVVYGQLSVSPAKPSSLSLSKGPRISQKFKEEFNSRRQNPDVITYNK
jgi:hypothetical protein